MLNFIRLIRPINIVIIFLTMYSLRFFYTDIQHHPPTTNLVERIDFFLLTISVLLIAAGGNIINDYFDVKADKVNKPHKLIISKYIKQRWAILSHWFFNGLAMLIGTYLSIKYKSVSFVFIFLICINLLWFYSVYFKRKALVGNLLVALLTAFVPISCGIYFNMLEISKINSNVSSMDWISYLSEANRLIYGMAIFAFLLNFAREIVKDILDAKGDLEIKATTLPIVYGKKVTKILASCVLMIIPILTLYMFNRTSSTISYDLKSFAPILAVQIIVVFAIFFLLITSKLKFVDRMLKIAMFFGLMLPFYWYFVV